MSSDNKTNHKYPHCYLWLRSNLSGISKIAGLYLNDLTESRTVRKNSIDFCTIHGFKGLERRAVLAIDVEDLLAEESRYLNYCGLSRARSYLAVFINKNDKDAYEKLAMDFGKRLAKLSKSNN